MNFISTQNGKAMTDQNTYTQAEDEMLNAYSRFRLDGVSKESALSYLFELGYKVTPSVVHTINKFSKHIFFGA